MRCVYYAIAFAVWFLLYGLIKLVWLIKQCFGCLCNSCCGYYKETRQSCNDHDKQYGGCCGCGRYCAGCCGGCCGRAGCCRRCCAETGTEASTSER